MKIKIDVDCTPQEARAFLGLPDVGPMQEAMMAQIQERMRAGLDAVDPETLMRTWLPLGLQGMEQAQRFWAQMGRAAGGTAGTAAGKKDEG